jgi:hypothetical protein
MRRERIACVDVDGGAENVARIRGRWGSRVPFVLEYDAAYKDKETELRFPLACRATEFYNVAKLDSSVEHGIDSEKSLPVRWRNEASNQVSPTLHNRMSESGCLKVPLACQDSRALRVHGEKGPHESLPDVL